MPAELDISRLEISGRTVTARKGTRRLITRTKYTVISVATNVSRLIQSK